MFKLRNNDNGKDLNCYINNILSYIFKIDTKTSKWNAFKVENNIMLDTIIDSDKYRYDLAERLDLSK